MGIRIQANTYRESSIRNTSKIWCAAFETGLDFWLQREIEDLLPSYIRDTTVTLEPGEITPWRTP